MTELIIGVSILGAIVFLAFREKRKEKPENKTDEAEGTVLPLPPKPPISRSGPAFPPAHQFR